MTFRRTCNSSRSLMAHCALGARRVWLSLILLGVWATPVLAQEEGPPEKTVRYVLSYVLLVLCIGLGLFGICRPGKRSKDVR